MHRKCAEEVKLYVYLKYSKRLVNMYQCLYDRGIEIKGALMKMENYTECLRRLL